MSIAQTSPWLNRVGQTFLAVVALAALAVPVQAQTINEIVNRKKVVIGVNSDAPPFSFINAQQKIDGFNVDFARLVAKHLGVEAEVVQVASANRIAFLVTKQVDLLVASLGVTPERAKQVMFTIPYVEAKAVIIAPKSKSLKELKDLSGIRVGTGRASSNDQFITELAPKDTNIMRFEGEAAAAQALLAGQVDAVIFTDNLSGQLMKANPALELEWKFPVRGQANSLTVRKDAFELQAWLNAMIYYVKTNGELDALYRKWLGFPLGELPVF